MRLMAASSIRRVEAIAESLYQLNKDALIAFDPLIKQAGAEHLVTNNGRLDAYRSEHAFAK